MNKFIAPASVLGLILSVLGYGLYTGQTAKPAFTPATVGAYTSSGKSQADTINALVRGDTLTFTCSGGIVAKGGSLTILNTAHYRDESNLPVLIPTSLLPAGTTPETLKGRTLTCRGSLTPYKGKQQWAATDVK